MKTVPGSVLHPLVAAITAGVALWLSRASFDVAGTTAATERVAMLPSLAELAGLTVLALLLAAGLALVLDATRKPGEPFWKAAGDPLLPLFGLSLLMLPYVPLIPDWVPALRILAGPARLVIWIIVIGQVGFALLPRPSPSTSGTLFGCTAVLLSAPFVMNARVIPAAFADLSNMIRHVPGADWSKLPAGSLGALFDQEYGILAYAPVLVLGFIGLAGMLRDRSQRHVAIPLALAALLLVVLAGTVDPWWNRSMLPGRPVLLLLPLLVPPMAWLYARVEGNVYYRAGAQLLLLVSLSVTVFMLVFANRVPARQEGDGASSLLTWMSPTWPLSDQFPSYVTSLPGAATMRVLWFGVLIGAALIVSRRRPVPPGRAALLATTIATLLVVTVSAATATLSSAEKRFDVEGRVVFPMLETFDTVARPIAVRYNAFSVVSPQELPPLFMASAVPGKRTAPQPVRVILNARFRLPAGTYLLDLKVAESAPPDSKGTIALQIGREGQPSRQWPLPLSPGDHIQQPFEVPLDAEFVGFRTSRQVEPLIAELRVTAVRVVDVRKRFRTPTVLAAATFGPARMFFHDSNSYTEADGFWVKGRATAQLTLQKSGGDNPGVPLAVHSGARANNVTFSTVGWSEKLDLVPGVTQRIVVPTAGDGIFTPVTISTADGFVPAEIEQSRDRRLLGAWVAVIPDDISRTSSAP